MSRCYEVLEKADAQKIFDQFPKIDVDQVTEQVNELFKPYLFFRRERDRTISMWASCCCRHGSMDNPPRTVGPVEAAILSGKHNDKAVCPYCGKEVTLKNISRLGKKKNLLEYQPVIILRAKDGDLYARCYWARKNYLDGLDDPPLFMDTYAMRFAIGRSEEVHDTYNGKYVRGVVEGNYDPVHRVITEPFSDGNFFYGPHYCPYYILGLEEIAKSDFKYCQYEHFEYDKCDSEQRPMYYDLCKYLSAYSIYPRGIEMLMKTGGKDLVIDLVCGRKKNRDIINWSATNPYDAFSLDKVELRAFRESGCSFEAIGWYKKLRKKDLQTSFASLYGLMHALGSYEVEDYFKACVSRGLRPDKLQRYLERFTGPRCHGGVYTLGAAFRTWKDYTVMAEGLDYDLTVETVLMPRNLDLAHQNAMEEIQLMRTREEIEKGKLQTAEEAGRIIQRRKKYNIELEGWFIRIAESAGEITNEGKMLEHCVGGYAQRHMSGATTILFLRRCEAPETPVYTIQMDGDKMVQIHGYRNEGVYSSKGRIAPDPQKTMAWLLDPWIEWLQKGSHRRKDGSAIIKAKMNQEVQSA